jgi:hypothetical protein
MNAPMQDPLFFESMNDALRAIVERVPGNGFKIVGHRLRPTKSPDAAGKWLADCLNTLRQERLDPDDVLMVLKVGREIGFHGAMQHIGGECSYRCEPIEPQDEQAALMRDYIEAVQDAKKIAAKLERLATGPTLTRAA